MSVKNLDIHPRYTTALLKARIFHVKKLLHFTKFEVTRKTGLSENAVEAIFNEAAKSVFTTPSSSVWNIINGSPDHCYQHGKLTTACPLIDNQLNGGIIFPGVTEISGESASGKTQFCIQLCLCVQMPTSNGGIEAGALYVCTEDAFPNKRLHQMAQAFTKLYCPVNSRGQPTHLTDQIYIEHAVDLDDLWSLLDMRINTLLSKHNVKLIIIDSIAALFRAEYNLSEMQERAKMLAKFGRRLNDISRKNHLCVICVNQVSDVFGAFNFNTHDKDGSRNVIPALGLTWAYFVNCRLMLSRTQWKTSMFPSTCSRNHIVQSDNIVVRTLKVTHSSHLPPSKSYFVVDKDGVKDFPLSKE